MLQSEQITAFPLRRRENTHFLAFFSTSFFFSYHQNLVSRSSVAQCLHLQLGCFYLLERVARPPPAAHLCDSIFAAVF